MTAAQQTELLTRLNTYVADTRGWLTAVTALSDLATIETRYELSGRQWAMRLLAEVNEVTVTDLYRTDLRVDTETGTWVVAVDSRQRTHAPPTPRRRIRSARSSRGLTWGAFRTLLSTPRADQQRRDGLDLMALEQSVRVRHSRGPFVWSRLPVTHAELPTTGTCAGGGR